MPPIAIDTSVAAKPTTSEMRAPHMSSVTMSMPPSSRPSGWLHDGRPNTGPTCVCTPYGAIHDARIAATAIPTRITDPTVADGRRRIVVHISPPRDAAASTATSLIR